MAEVEELLGDNAGECGSHHSANDRLLGHATREQVNVPDVTVSDFQSAHLRICITTFKFASHVGNGSRIRSVYMAMFNGEFEFHRNQLFRRLRT